MSFMFTTFADVARTPAARAGTRSAGSSAMSFLPLICSSLPSLRQLGPATHLTSMWAPHDSSVPYLQHQSQSRLAGSSRPPHAAVPELTHGQARRAVPAQLRRRRAQRARPRGLLRGGVCPPRPPFSPRSAPGGASSGPRQGSVCGGLRRSLLGAAAWALSAAAAAEPHRGAAWTFPGGYRRSLLGAAAWARPRWRSTHGRRE